MSSYTLYHNPQCSKSREALAYLKDKGIEVEVIEYLKEPLTKDELLELMGELNSPAATLVRKKEVLFQEAPFDVENKELVAKKIAATPRLMERPILRGNRKAAIGRPLENFETVLDSKN